MRLVTYFIALTLCSCGSPKLDIPKSDHYDGERFFNPTMPDMGKSFYQFLKWRLFGERDQWPKWVKVEQLKIEKSKTEVGELSVTFINHATVLIQLDGINILTDPLFSYRTSPVSWAGPKRSKPPGIKLEDLPPIDIILISHNHFDAMDIPTLNLISKRDKPKIIFGLGNSYYLSDASKEQSVELDWGQKFTFKGVDFNFLPVQHWAKRTLNDFNKALWGGFAIVGSKKVYFAGDSGYCSHFRDAGNKFDGFDLSLIPIGAYEPRWFMKAAHMNPEESYKVHLDLKSKLSIAIHHGTFQLTDESIDDPVKDLQDQVNKHPNNPPFIVLENGESYSVR